VQRSWRTIEPARARAGRGVVGAGGKRLAGNGFNGDCHDGRQEAGKTGVQRAACIRRVSATIAMVARHAVVTAALRMMMMGREASMWSASIWNAPADVTGMASARGDDTMPANWATRNRPTSRRVNHGMVRSSFMRDASTPS
jgi:hypothetical protein